MIFAISVWFLFQVFLSALWVTERRGRAHGFKKMMAFQKEKQSLFLIFIFQKSMCSKGI